MNYLVDGYNLLRVIENSGDRPEPLTDLQMCHILGRYFKSIANDGCVIFDGKGPPDKSGFYSIGYLEVIFSGVSLEADDVIENKINTSSAPKQVIVVSDDRRLRTAAHRRKAVSMRCRPFWNDVLRQLKRADTTKRTEPDEKHFGITESETDQWLNFFNLEQ